MSHGDAIPAMQMQTCMIFVQILLSGSIIISQLSPFLVSKDDDGPNVERKMEKKMFLKPTSRGGWRARALKHQLPTPLAQNGASRTPTVNDYYPPFNTSAMFIHQLLFHT